MFNFKRKAFDVYVRSIQISATKIVITDRGFTDSKIRFVRSNDSLRTGSENILRQLVKRNQAVYE